MYDVALADNATTRAALYKRLLDCTLIVPDTVSGGTERGSGKRVADPDTRFFFRTVEHPPGNIVLPVFTDVQALIDWAQEGTPWVGLASRDLFRGVVATNINEIRVNPFRPVQRIKKSGGVITRVEFQALGRA